jgi:hypothetical protein
MDDFNFHNFYNPHLFTPLPAYGLCLPLKLLPVSALTEAEVFDLVRAHARSGKLWPLRYEQYDMWVKELPDGRLVFLTVDHSLRLRNHPWR